MTTKRKCLVPSSNSLVLKMNRLFRNAECLVVPNADYLVPNADYLVPNADYLVPNVECLLQNADFLCHK